jgi:G3E family GTPase
MRTVGARRANACSGEVGTGSPTRTCVTQESNVPDFVLLTGSLGSGKTTLLADYLALPESADTGVIVNEAGEINVDGAVVSSGRRDLPMALLSNGCVCCSLGDDLHSAIDELLAIRRRSAPGGFRRIVLETSGLALPGPILRSLMAYDRAAYRLRIVSTFDALDPMIDATMLPIRAAQLTAAASIVVTKLDVAGPDRRAAALRLAGDFNPAAGRIALADRCERARAAFAPREIERLASSAFHAIETTAHPRLQVFRADWRDPVAWTDLSDWLEDLAGFCGERLLRVKGFVAVAGVAEAVLIDGVGTTFAAPRRMLRDGPIADGLVIIARDIALDDLVAWSRMSAAGQKPDLRPTNRPMQ